jgi:hypothetical protein
MKKDLPENIVEGVAIAVVLEDENIEARSWKVYVLNLRENQIQNVLISSKGYGNLNGEQVKTSVFRHFIGNLDAQKFAAIELIDEKLFAINNEFWLSYYINGEIFDKKYIFLTESISESNFIRIPYINKPGVMIK